MMNETIFEHDCIKEVKLVDGIQSIKYLCPYCGKEMKHKTISDFHGWDDEEHIYCDCEDAEKAKSILKQIRDLKMKMPKKKYAFRYIDEKHSLFSDVDSSPLPPYAIN